MRLLLAVVAILVMGCDERPRFEQRGEILYDNETDLTYDAQAIAEEREEYRRFLRDVGQAVPGLPLVLTDEQRQRLQRWETEKKAIESACARIEDCGIAAGTGRRSPEYGALLVDAARCRVEMRNAASERWRTEFAQP